VRARDDFLSRVTALVEGNAAQHVEVQHLRHELLRGRGVHLGFAGGDCQPLPVLRLSGRRIRQDRRLIDGSEPQPARRLTWQTQYETALDECRAAVLGR
jgi:hypothetical protein